MLETLAIITYKQPVSRGDIEQIRGVGVSQNIMRTLLERADKNCWTARSARPACDLWYDQGVLRLFLDAQFDQLPPLDEIREMIEPVIEAEKAVAEAAAKAASANAETSVTEADTVVEEVTESRGTSSCRRRYRGQPADSEATDSSACNMPHPLRMCSVAPQQSQADQGDGEKLQKVQAAQGLGSRRQMEN